MSLTAGAPSDFGCVMSEVAAAQDVCGNIAVGKMTSIRVALSSPGLFGSW